MSAGTKWRVLKFGGSSVSSLKDWQNITTIVAEHLAQGFKVVVIHSAFKNVTNQLEQLAQAALKAEHQPIFDELVEQHYKLADELDLARAIVEPWFESLGSTLSSIAAKENLSPCDRAELVAHGELLSSSLGEAYLAKNLTQKTLWLDARKVLTAVDDTPKNVNEYFLNAVCHPRPDKGLSQEWAEQAEVVLSQGFIASNSNGQTVLLGREGSDTSAAYFAVLTSAESLQVWTDVDGIYSCDPNKVNSAIKIDHLSYNQAFDLAQAGAKVLHPRCLSAIAPQRIPVEIRSTKQPEVEGTRVDENHQDSKWIKAIALKQQVPVITLLLGRRGQQPDILQKVFAIINEFGLTSELLASTKESLVLEIDNTNSIYTEQVLNELSAKLAEVCMSVFLSHSAIITLVGCQASQALWHLLQIEQQHLPEQWLLLSHTSSDHHLSFLVNDEEAEQIVNLLHDSLIKGSG
ncbi:aspartate kinase [Kangiella sp. TOML190]|uniref:aspartate kinase n=1 Tax=Kangiella sp. TOML190 TaxID=2931351 RepID=UPI00203CAF10|nr:aspartate kinase [Kangiella sp. TOML190]